MYKQGQKLVCIKSITKVSPRVLGKINPPKEGEIYTFERMSKKTGYIILAELPGCRVDMTHFAPVQDNSNKSVIKDLANEFVLVPEKLDVIQTPVPHGA